MLFVKLRYYSQHFTERFVDDFIKRIYSLVRFKTLKFAQYLYLHRTIKMIHLRKIPNMHNKAKFTVFFSAWSPKSDSPRSKCD